MAKKLRMRDSLLSQRLLGVIALSLLAHTSATAKVALETSVQEPKSEAKLLVLDRVTIVDVEQGKLLPDQRVVISGSRIQMAGPAGRVSLPRGAQVVAAQGKYLIPGLWDMHTHSDTLADVFYPLFIANGVTGVRDAWGYLPIQIQAKWWREILEGSRVGPPRQLLSGRPASHRWGGSGVQTLTFAMDSLRKAGAQLLKVYPYTATQARVARQLGMPFGGHVGDVAATEASDSGMTIIDHLYSSQLDSLCYGASASTTQCESVLKVFQRNNTWWTPTLIIHAKSNEKVAASLSVSPPYFARIMDLARAFWEGSPFPSGNWLRDSTSFGTTAAPGLHIPQTPRGVMRIASQLGFPILAGTDVATWDIWKMPPGASLHTELAMLVAEGLTPLDALRSATLNPAKLLHGTDSLGTVATGKLADLVLLDADPLADITNTTMIRAVIANGRYFDRAALDRLIAEGQTLGRALPPEFRKRR